MPVTPLLYASNFPVTVLATDNLVASQFWLVVWLVGWTGLHVHDIISGEWRIVSI